MKKLLTVATATALALSSSPLAGAQEPAPSPELTPAAPTSASTRAAAPDTNSCPFSLLPPEPVDTSEVPAPGQPSPTPLPPTQTSDCGITVPEGFRVPAEVLASAWMVADIDTGEIVAMKDPHGRYRPASIIKALIALVAIEELDLRQRVVVTEEDAGVEGSAVGLGPGGVYTVEQLLLGLLLSSGNDAAHALATVLGGDAAALDKVNAKARQLGTQDTFAASYSGLDAPGMSTSTADMALIYHAAYNNPTFARLVRTESVDFPGYGDTPGYELWNDNGLLLNDPDGIGGKTGFTDNARHTFVGALDRGGRRLMAIILDTTVDHGQRAWNQAQMLLDEAYTIPVGRGVSNLTEHTSQQVLDAQTAASEAAKAQEAADKARREAEAAARAQQEAQQESLLSWIIVSVIGLAAIAVAAFSLLQHPRRGRGSRARRSPGSRK